MTRRRARLSLAVALAATLVPAMAPSALAECPNLAVDPVARLSAGAAFLATVTEVSDDVDANLVANPWDLHVELSVESIYAGDVPSKLSFNDYDGGCGELLVGALRPGDRIIVAVEQLPLSYLPAAPFEGHIVVWKKTAGGWSFFQDALAFGSQALFYPGAPRDATTKADVLEVIAGWTMPATSTIGDPVAPDTATPALWIGFAFVLGLAVSLFRFRQTPDVRQAD